MIDWTRSMAQKWSFCEVDPATWRDSRELAEVVGGTITRDLDSDVRESASLETDSMLSQEAYVRVYLDVAQGVAAGGRRSAESERVPVGTFLCQTPTRRADGRTRTLSVEAYSPLLELAEDRPPYGYTARGDVEEALASIVSSACRAPFVGYGGSERISGAIVANEDDTWLSFCRTVAAVAGCDIGCDAYGNVVMEPERPKAALRPSWTFDDSNASILLPEVSETVDWYGLPNRCEVVWSEEGRVIVGVAENSDPSSPLSTVSRGRKVSMRHDNPDGLGEGCTKAQADALARRLLEDSSVVEREISISHGFCPVRIGDAVRVMCAAHGIDAVAQVVRQEVSCDTGATVQSTCRVTERMWSA